MEYRFIHYWQYEPGEVEHIVLESAISLSAEARKENFLSEAAAFISEHTGARYVVIGLLTEDYSQIQTCTFLKDMEVLQNHAYPIEGTPCQDALTQRFCYFPVKVAENFPNDKHLRNLQIESYLGSILLSEAGEPLGVVALMSDKTIEDAAFAEHLILVLSPALEGKLKELKAKSGSISFKPSCI